MSSSAHSTQRIPASVRQMPSSSTTIIEWPLWLAMNPARSSVSGAAAMFLSPSKQTASQSSHAAYSSVDMVGA